MPRLFVALEIGSTAQDRVADEQARLAGMLRSSSLRWVKRDQLHITLVFIGQLSEEGAAQAVESMHETIPLPPFRFDLGGLGAFPPRGAPRALWLAVKSGASHIVGVQAVVAERFEALGVARERRPFSPHLTLARWRDSRLSARPPTGGDSPPTTASVDVTAVTLFQSRVSSAGSTYSVLARSTLVAP